MSKSKAEETADTKDELKYIKDAVISLAEYRKYRDVLQAFLKEDQEYTLEEVNRKIKAILTKKPRTAKNKEVR